ncbi:Phage terminase-like protein, large subunit, contains N-terminal HTH domain [Bradyrhizobium brasilense]|uniref:Phage terminase-like protein, large subunit, contains N-terminal HTH domain n=1 Tax=Bradyrhizobium brasilense TaxID=1419277 RepID=A0A1G6IKW4_9BRAD|nr:terminase large subunit [Bradyrhizobium brasilense]SDC07128.1 Phage terminase-like protein, large subunit, contains N-terminal HTH domain [Bradyrhizobium brasilense]
MRSTKDLPRFACPDWWEKIQAGQTPMATVPLNEARAAKALAFFNRLRLPDIAGNPPLAEACGDWFRDILCAFLASEDPATKRRLVWELLCMVPKKNSKTTYVAALGLTALFMEETPNRQMLIVAPSQNISERCFAQAQGMIRIDSRLDAIFQVQDHLKCITRRKTGTSLDVKSFDTAIVTGEIPVLTIIDELHELGKKAKAQAVMQQIRGGSITTQGGQVLMITTQSDEEPAGIWKTELKKARAIRDGVGGSNPILLPVLYEFPDEQQRDQTYWRNTNNWPLILPNIGRSIDSERLIEDYENNGRATREAETIWVSQHLNIEIGVGQKNDGWAGAEFWEQGEDESISFESILERCEVVIFSLDGGGLDDLYGGNVLGREKETRDWLSWSHAWCHTGVLDRRQSIASRLRDFKAARELTIYETAGEDIVAIIELISEIKDRGLLGAVTVDPAGLGEMVEALAEIDVTVENKLLMGAPQGYGMMNAIKTAERKLQNGTLRHAKSALMDWCVGNVKIEPLATAIRATKQNAGDAKIDPWAALMNGVWMMARNPAAAAVSRSGWNTDDIDGLMDKINAAADALVMGDADDGRQMVQGVGRPV